MSTMGHPGGAGRTATSPRGPVRRRPGCDRGGHGGGARVAAACPSHVGAGAAGPENCQRDALTARAAVLTIQRSKGSKRKDSRVDEEALIVWQDVLDMVVNGRPNEVACPHCNHRPLTIEEIEQTTRISCSKCGKFIQGRFTH